MKVHLLKKEAKEGAEVAEVADADVEETKVEKDKKKVGEANM